MSSTTSQTPRVTVIQNGARHDYAIPNAFAASGWLEMFHTDICTYSWHVMGRERSGPARECSTLAQKKTVGRNVTPHPSRSDRDMENAAPVTSGVFRLLNLCPAATRDSRRAGRSPAETRLRECDPYFQRGWGRRSLSQEAKAAGLPVLTDIYIAFSTLNIERAEWEAFPDWGPEPMHPEDATIDERNHALETITNTSIFVCPSAFVADDLVANWGGQRDAIRIVPYAASRGWETIVPRPRKGRVLFAGSAVRRKGIHILAKTARLLAQQGRDDIEFLVAGDVPDVVRNHPEANALTFLGRVPRDKMRDHFAEADIFVLPTLAEGSATVVYEAMAVGLPVITTHEAGAPITAGIDGIIVPARDIEALATAITGLVDDRDRRDKIAAMARQSATNFTPEKQAKRICGLIDDTNGDSSHSFQFCM